MEGQLIRHIHMHKLHLNEIDFIGHMVMGVPVRGALSFLHAPS
jgi:hypothetical protein